MFSDYEAILHLHLSRPFPAKPSHHQTAPLSGQFFSDPIFPLDSLGESAYIPNQLRGPFLTESTNDQAQLLPGTLDLLILRAVSLGPLHGYGILLRIGQISANALMIEQGALYPGLFRLVRQGLLKASWGTSENNRRAKFYALTVAGRKRLREETESWNRLAAAISAALSQQPEEA
jgi:PadR family transcriptional regulator PadR